MDPQSAQDSLECRPRRSTRVLLSLPVLVQGETDGAGSMLEETDTLVVSAHGALITLAMPVELGQGLLLKNQKTQEEQPCTVVYLGALVEGKTPVGVEFSRPAPHFWPIEFPQKDQ